MGSYFAQVFFLLIFQFSLWIYITYSLYSTSITTRIVVTLHNVELYLWCDKEKYSSSFWKKQTGKLADVENS